MLANGGWIDPPNQGVPEAEKPIMSSHSSAPSRGFPADFQAWFEHAQDPFLLLDSDCVVLAATEAALRIVRTLREEVVGKRIFDVFPDAPNLRASLDRKRHSAESGPMPDSGRYLLWINPADARLRDPEHFIAVIDDSLQTQPGEHALEESEQKYRALFENSHEALMVYSPPSRQVTSASRIALQMFGANTLDALSSLGLSPQFQPDGALSAEKEKEMMDIAMRQGHHRFEWMHQRADGTIFPAEVRLTRIESAAQVFIQASLRDISAPKRMEQKFRDQARKKHSLNRHQVAARTASLFAHELNQPLMAISSFSETALMMLHSLNPDRIRIGKAIENGKRQALRAGLAVQQLLDLLNMEETGIEKFNLAQEVVNLFNFTRSGQEYQFHSELRLANDLPPVTANRIQVHKAIQNLLNNSIEAMEADGGLFPTIIVTVKAHEEGMAMISIQDNGPGIPLENRDHLFEPFFTTKANGVGMGLVISRSLIEVNGGFLWLDHQENRGATFHLTLPLAYE